MEQKVVTGGHALEEKDRELSKKTRKIQLKLKKQKKVE